MAVCAPFPYLADVALSLTGQPASRLGRRTSAHGSAHTGEVSRAMLAGVRLPVRDRRPLERRAYHGENQLVADKAKARWRGHHAHRLRRRDAGQREAGETDAVVKRQLSAVIHTLGHCISEVVVAYEPV